MRFFQQTVVVLCSPEAQPGWVREELEEALWAAGTPALVLPATPRVVEALRRLPVLPRALVLCVGPGRWESCAGAELLGDADYLARPGLRFFVARGAPGLECRGVAPSCVPCPFAAPERFAAALRALPGPSLPAAEPAPASPPAVSAPAQPLSPATSAAAQPPSPAMRAPVQPPSPATGAALPPPCPAVGAPRPGPCPVACAPRPPPARARRMAAAAAS